jgi:uncharacterized protein YbdZ (MbtH family)
MYIPRNWEFGSALAKLRNFVGWGVDPPKPPFGTPLHSVAVIYNEFEVTIYASPYSRWNVRCKLPTDGWQVTQMVDQQRGSQAQLPVLIAIFIGYIARPYGLIPEPVTYHSTILSSIHKPTNKFFLSPACNAFNDLFKVLFEAHTTLLLADTPYQWRTVGGFGGI